MKKYFKVILLGFLLVGFNNLKANLNINGGDVLTYGTGSYGVVTVSGKVTFTGDVTASSITINSGGIMIVNGNLEIVTSGNAKLIVNGTLVITGNLNIDSSGSSESNTINTAGTLIVGGSYDYGGKDSKETNNGSVYLSDPTDWDNGGGIEGTGGDIGDLIDSGVIPDEILEEFIENYDGGGLPSYTWNGASNTFWDITSNWSSGEIPGKADNVTISAGSSSFPTGCSGSKVYLMWNLTIEAGAEFTIPAGSQVSVYGDITVPASSKLVIENSALNPTSFINYGDISGDITVEWNYEVDRYWYIGHSISNPTISSYEVNNYRLFRYTGSWTEITGTSNFGGVLDGYALKITDASALTVSHKGTLNNTDLDQVLISGYQLISNPYASYYQLPIEDPSTGDFRNTTGSVYVRTGTSTRTFETFNTLTGISSPATFDGVIAPGQCFWVERSSTATDVDKVYMRKSNRLHGSTSLKSTSLSSGSNSNLLRIKLRNENGTDEAVIAFREYGQLKNTRFDSRQKYELNNLSYIYSLKGDCDNVIGVYPEDFIESVVPLGIKSKNGEHILSISGLNEIDPALSVYLVDKYAGIEIDMREEREYSFESEDANVNDRFEVKFEKVTTSLEAGLDMKKSRIIIYSSDSEVFVNLDSTIGEQSFVQVYGMNGQLLFQQSFYGKSYKFKPKTLPGLYLVKVKSNNCVVTEKVLIE